MANSAIFYSIRHKPTNWFISVYKGRPSTSHPLSPLSTHSDYTPRMFRNALCAKRALTAWMLGEWSTDHEGYYSQDKPKVPRVFEDMEIIPVLLDMEPKLP